MVSERFMTDLRITTQKYSDKGPSQVLKLLFHGSRQTKPEQIYASDEGLDMRFSRDGMFGVGIYFANNAAYSHTYAYHESDGTLQIFLVWVNQGKACRMSAPDQSLRLPPLLGTDQVQRYDSVLNAQGDHTIIYSNTRQYPGFLITYKLV